jgi:hypothetical protein
VLGQNPADPGRVRPLPVIESFPCFLSQLGAGLPEHLLLTCARNDDNTFLVCDNDVACVNGDSAAPHLLVEWRDSGLAAGYRYDAPGEYREAHLAYLGQVGDRLDAVVWTADRAWGTGGRIRQIR